MGNSFQNMVSHRTKSSDMTSLNAILKLHFMKVSSLNFVNIIVHRCRDWRTLLLPGRGGGPEWGEMPGSLAAVRRPGHCLLWWRLRGRGGQSCTSHDPQPTAQTSLTVTIISFCDISYVTCDNHVLIVHIHDCYKFVTNIFFGIHTYV